MDLSHLRWLAVIVLLGTVPGIPCQESKQAPHAAQTFSAMTSALDAIGAEYGVPIGIEYIPNYHDRNPITLDFSHAAINTVLGEFIAQRPEYTWRVDGGVYDIYPKESRDSILAVTIQRFAVNAATPQQISALLGELPEVKEWLTRNHVRRNELEVGSRWNSPDTSISLSITDASLRTVLNRIALSSGRQKWTVIRYGEHSEFVGIYI
jgi:hypothetical protein